MTIDQISHADGTMEEVRWLLATATHGLILPVGKPPQESQGRLLQVLSVLLRKEKQGMRI